MGFWRAKCFGGGVSGGTEGLILRGMDGGRVGFYTIASYEV